MENLKNKWPLLGLVIANLMTACGTKVYNSCPIVTSYSQEFNNALADELQTMPPQCYHNSLEPAGCSPSRSVIVDYAQLRDRVKICNED